MSAPAWFDKDVYLANKLVQLKADEPKNGWTEMKMLEAFNNAGYDPFNADAVFAHFEAYGNAENVSPNQYFDVQYYMNSKLTLLKTTEPDAGWDMDKLEQAFKDAGLSAWDHYTLYGISEGINPSIFFNTGDYMKAKLDQMRADDPTYTKDDLLKAFKDADLNPIEHYVLFGKNENLSYSPYAVDGGYAPLPEKGISVAEAQKLTEPGYILEDNVSNLAGADYTVINNAKSVTVADAVSGFTDANTAKVLAFADNVVVKDALATIAQNVLNGTLPDFGNTSTSLLVTGTSATATIVNLGTVSVAVAAEGQTLLDVFLARTDVSYQDGKPTALTLGTYGIEDTAANVVAADADLLSGATSVTVDDTVANVSANLAGIQSAGADAIHVTDTLDNIFGMSNGTATSLMAASATFVATDEGDATVTYSALMGTLGDGTHKIDITAADSVTLNASAQAGALTVNLDNLFTATDDTTVSYIGSTGADTVTANAKGGIIDGGLGADTITLGAGVDTVVLGSGITNVTALASNASNADTISSFSAGANGDKLDFAGLLSDFEVGTDGAGLTTVASNGGTAQDNNALVGNVVLVSSVADFTAASNIASSFFSDGSYAEGDKMILITSAGTSGDSYVWYVENADADGKITDTEIHLVATINGLENAAATLKADNFA